MRFPEIMCYLLFYPAFVLFDLYFLWLKTMLKGLYGSCRITVPTDKNIQRHIIQFRPCMNADMGFCKNGNTRDTAFLSRRVKLDFQYRRSTRIGRFAYP